MSDWPASSWIGQARASVRRGETLAMATVVGAMGSTPREAGARLLVWPDRFAGTIGGGALEVQALRQARGLLAQRARRHALQDYPLGPLLGQCCGGRVRLLVERLDEGSLGWLDAAAAAWARGEPFRLEAAFGGSGMTRAVQPAEADADAAGPRTPVEQVRSLSELISPHRPHVLMFGAGHVGQAVARCLAPLPFAVEWLASREDLDPAVDDPRAEVMPEEDLHARIAAAPAGASYVIFTHSHDLDYRLTMAVLEKGDFGYLGLIGSATKRVRFERRLRTDGVTDEMLSRLTCPIGLPELKSKEPAVIAVSLAAQLLQVTEAR